MQAVLVVAQIRSAPYITNESGKDSSRSILAAPDYATSIVSDLVMLFS
jgi:hypothetical protein